MTRLAIDFPCLSLRDSEELEVSIGLSTHKWSASRNLMLWLLGGAIIGALFYKLLDRLPDSVQGIILLVAVVAIWYHADVPKRTTKAQVTLLFWLPIVVGLFCVLEWKLTRDQVWVTLGIACACVRAAYRVYPLPE